MVANKQTYETNSLEWWAFSETHGWVVLDKTLVENRIRLCPEGFQFIRCRDGEIYEQGKQAWDYKEANRYLDTLPPAEALRAERELLELQAEYREELAA